MTTFEHGPQPLVTDAEQARGVCDAAVRSVEREPYQPRLETQDLMAQ